MYLLPLLIPLLERYIDGNFPSEGSIEPKFKLPHIHAANDSGFIEEETINIPDLEVSTLKVLLVVQLYCVFGKLAKLISS